MNDLALAAHPRGVILPVRARAGAARNAIAGVHNGQLRVSVTAAPEKGRANKAIIELLADALHLPRSSLELISGDTSQQKKFLVEEVDIATVRRLLSD